MSQDFSTSKRVQVKVLKHLPLGLLVEVEARQQGIVRVRETAWEPEQRANWQQFFPPGWVGWAVALKRSPSHHKEYSLRLAESDPWDDLPDGVDSQQTYAGIVTGVTNFGAFIELASGLTGLLHRSKLPTWANNEPIDIFWPGDQVCVVIHAINHEERRISLCLPPISPPPAEGQKLPPALRGFHEEGENLSTLTQFLSSGSARHILLVEDEPEQRAAVANWLTRVGQHVDAVESAEKAIAFLQTSRPDLALIDVGLPGMNGADLAAKICAEWPRVQAVIATDWARQESMSQILEDLRAQGVELYPKPLLPEDLIAMLRRDKPATATLTAASTQPPRPGPLLRETLPTVQPKISIHNLLGQCRRHLGFEQALLFELDPIHRAVTLPERSGGLPLDKNALASLVYSPVRDVAEDHEVLTLAEMSASQRERFRYLLELSPYMESGIGVPVSAEVQASFALFLISDHPRPISDEQRLYAEAMAQAIGTLIEQKNFREKAILIQRTALIGHLTRAMVHEINNLVGPLASRLDNLQTNLARLEKSPNPAEAQERKNTLITTALNDTQQIILRIINTTRMFGRVVSKGKNEILRLDQIIEETIHLLRDTSDRAHVRMVFDPPAQMLVIRNQAAAFEQVLLNVMLNAVQQINETRPETGGWVQVRIDEAIDPTQQGFFRILIEDNGPGIHARLWEKIFEAGYTTRHEGSGIGLYISRNLVEEMGGRIYVKESCMLGGTLFALEIPSQF